MRKHINITLGIIILYSGCSFLTIDNLYADDLPQFVYDTSGFTPRNFDRKALDNFKTDPDFDYAVNEQEVNNNGYQLTWLGRLLKKLLGISFNKETAGLWEIFIYII